MIFHCPQCHTKYDFDESQIPAGGVSVQCSNCPKIFEVQPPQKQDEPVPQWELRQTTGAHLKFNDLAILQKWIIEQKVFREDQISKAGGAWRTLGDIPELSSFFKAVDNQQQNMMPGYGYHPGPMANTYASQPPYQQTNNQVTGQMPYMNTSQPWQQQGLAQPPQTMGANLTPTEGDYAILKQHSRHPALKISFFFLLAIGAGIAAFYFVDPQSFETVLAQPVLHLLGRDGINTEAKAAFDSAQDKVYLGDSGSLEEASNLLFQATTKQKKYVAAIALDAQIKLMQADMKVEEIYWLEKENKSPEIQTKLRLMSNHLAENGFNLAKQALELDPNNRVALRVMIDYYRHKKALNQAEPLIKQALNFPNHYLDITLGLAYLEESSTEQEGLKLLKDGLANFPIYSQGHYFLAKYYYEHDKRQEAAKEVEIILKDVPKHEMALKLKEELARPQPAATPAPKAAPAMTTAQLIQKANRLRNNDHPKEAQAIYEKIIDNDASNIQALIGMGWCYIDLGYNESAIESFKKARNINKTNAEAHYGLAEAYRAAGKKAEALTYYRVFLQLAPNHPDADIVRNAIKELQ